MKIKISIRKAEFYNKRIDRGVALLDALYGKNKWIKQINIEQLDLGDSAACVAGQIFNDQFEAVIEALNCLDEVSRPQDFGFDISSGDNLDYDILTQLWIERINKLKRIKSSKKR